MINIRTVAFVGAMINIGTVRSFVGAMINIRTVALVGAMINIRTVKAFVGKENFRVGIFRLENFLVS